MMLASERVPKFYKKHLKTPPRWRKRPRFCLSTKSAVKKFKEF